MPATETNIPIRRQFKRKEVIKCKKTHIQATFQTPHQKQFKRHRQAEKGITHEKYRIDEITQKH